MNAGDVSLACASMLVDELVRCGVRHVVVSPGARSTPLTLAAARNPAVETHVVLDERSAAFVALGIAKATRVPAAVVCTSGTAAANYLPAVVEAKYSATPLVVLTSDRPPHLHGTGANQTIEQRGLYSRFVLFEEELSLPVVAADTAATWRSVAARAVNASNGAVPGPVHLNLPFDEPLVPSGEPIDLGPDQRGRAGSARWETPANRDDAPADDAVRTLAESINRAERGVLVFGGIDGPTDSLKAFAEKLGWPLVAEPQSQLRIPGIALSAPQLLLNNPAFAESHVPDVVLRIGDTPTSRATLTYVAAAPNVISVDPARRVATVHPLQCDANVLAAMLLDRIPGHAASAWTREWHEADIAARTAVDKLLDSFDAPTGPRVARDLAAAIPPGSALCAGSSMPIRYLDGFMAPRDGLNVIVNRGASGIDGFVSTSFGVAATGAPTYAFLGDLTLLHDASGLIWNASKLPPVTFVVPNDDGGGIFSFLPQAALPEHVELFATPHGIDLSSLAATARCDYARADKPDELAPLIAQTLGRSRIIEVPLHRADALKRLAEIAGTVEAAIS